MSRPYLIHYQQHKHIITSRASPCLISILRWLIGWRNSIPHHLDNILMFQVTNHLGTRSAAVPFWQEAVPPHPRHRQLQGLHQDQEHRALRQRHLHLHGWVQGGGGGDMGWIDQYGFSFYWFYNLVIYTENFKSALKIGSFMEFFAFLGINSICNGARKIFILTKIFKWWLDISLTSCATLSHCWVSEGLSKTWQLSCLLCDCQRLPSTTCHSLAPKTVAWSIYNKQCGFQFLL